ncbi:AzlC family ABC transporter permease [Haloarcula argentinensis]|uniref:AzlC family ABC transporter permease n=1 Tax=Haloarcula argentinensis TaxID=43776 RepID=A0A830FVB3_HALAR|nr:AzlC family ABC transporter permease [Haloarcula argentinensis]EMA19222.1 branched-chain amino acid transport protein AzlC [Haloarcula argentinensis DSM 12282]MDS0254287.1 AzlC family ABC transporter permease [Haloarcula argentinensis]GGM42887.1 AzlC family protein [Haloarcula argentinensis]
MDTASFRRGVRDVAPLLLGIIPFGLVAGIATVNAGLGLPAAVGLSVVVFAGASQLAALELLGQNAPLTVVVATAVVINLRLLMYSASIAPYFREFTGRWKAVLAYVLTDQAYALSVASYRSDSETDQKWYYLGVAVTLWAVWQVTTVVGALLGTGIPDAWGLEFAIPLVFLAILVPAIEDAATAVAAVVGGAIAVVGAGFPLNLGLLVAAGVGITAGVLTESAAGGTDGD